MFAILGVGTYEVLGVTIWAAAVYLSFSYKNLEGC